MISQYFKPGNALFTTVISFVNSRNTFNAISYTEKYINRFMNKEHRK